MALTPQTAATGSSPQKIAPPESQFFSSGLGADWACFLMGSLRKHTSPNRRMLWWLPFGSSIERPDAGGADLVEEAETETILWAVFIGSANTQPTIRLLEMNMYT